jgi:hypothetical protein
MSISWQTVPMFVHQMIKDPAVWKGATNGNECDAEY